MENKEESKSVQNVTEQMDNLNLAEPQAWIGGTFGPGSAEAAAV